MFDFRYSSYFSSRLYANSSVTSSEWDIGFYPPQMRWILPCGWISNSDEVDSGFYPPQMGRRDWSDSFVYVTIHVIHSTYDY